MFQQERVTNVHALLGDIGSFLEGTPANGTERVDWERFSDRKKRALSSLDLLYRMFGQDNATSGCEGGKPVIKGALGNVTYGCEGGKPVIKNAQEGITYGCEGGKPVIKNTQEAITYGCEGGKPVIKQA